MVNYCTILLEKDTYYPGQTINGRVDCNFLSEDKVKAIYVKLKGKAKVCWSEGSTNTSKADEKYFEMESDLLERETTFQPGIYSYPFTFNLLHEIPPTFHQPYGTIKYFVEAVISRPWTMDYKDKRVITVHSYLDLNTINDLKNPADINIVKKPLTFHEESARINFSVHLPVTGFVPLQMVMFNAKVKNDSRIDVRGVQFHLVQGFTFHRDETPLKLLTYKGEIFKVINSLVAPGRENSWDLEIRVPVKAFTGNMKCCKLIKVFTELRGKLILPITHKDLKLNIPITVGYIPLRT